VLLSTGSLSLLTVGFMTYLKVINTK